MSIETHLVSLRTYMEEMTAQQREIIGLLKQLAGQPQAVTEPTPKKSAEPWDGYDALNVADVLTHLTDNTFPNDEWARILAYEKAHKNRRGVIDKLEEWGGE